MAFRHVVMDSNPEVVSHPHAGYYWVTHRLLFLCNFAEAERIQCKQRLLPQTIICLQFYFVIEWFCLQKSPHF